MTNNKIKLKGRLNYMWYVFYIFGLTLFYSLIISFLLGYGQKYGNTNWAGIIGLLIAYVIFTSYAMYRIIKAIKKGASENNAGKSSSS